VAAWAIWLVLFRRSRDQDPIHEAPTVVLEKPRRIHPPVPPVPPAPPVPPVPPLSNGSETDAAKSETAPNEPI
jgi:hypothetical protein